MSQSTEATQALLEDQANYSRRADGDERGSNDVSLECLGSVVVQKAAVNFFRRSYQKLPEIHQCRITASLLQNSLLIQ